MPSVTVDVNVNVNVINVFINLQNNLLLLDHWYWYFLETKGSLAALQNFSPIFQSICSMDGGRKRHFEGENENNFHFFRSLANVFKLGL